MALALLWDHLNLAKGERQRPLVFEGPWWTSATVNTVGYDDILPVTTAGLLVAVVTVGRWHHGLRHRYRQDRR